MDIIWTIIGIMAVICGVLMIVNTIGEYINDKIEERRKQTKPNCACSSNSECDNE